MKCIKVICRGGSRISREGGPNKGEGLHYEAMQYLLYLNAGWKDKYPGLQGRGNLSVPG